jgi:hypothetical protein
MLKDLNKIFKLAESSTVDSVRKKLYDFSNDYRKYKLHPEYYRELNDASLFRRDGAARGIGRRAVGDPGEHPNLAARGRAGGFREARDRVVAARRCCCRADPSAVDDE